MGYSPWGCKEPDITERLTLINKLLGVGDGSLVSHLPLPISLFLSYLGRDWGGE